jgi:hypothetical protein
MKTTTELTANLWKGPVPAMPAPASLDALAADAVLSKETAMVVNRLFRELRSIHSAWKTSWPDMESYKDAKRTWTKALMEASVSDIDQLRFGLMRSRQGGSPFIPAPGDFIKSCEPTAEMLGLPDVSVAYREACRLVHPSIAGRGRWSHNAIYHAAKESGFDNLNRLDGTLGLMLFERNYTIAVRRLVSGQPLQAMPKGLPSEVAARRTPEVARAALHALRCQVGGRHVQ